MKVEVLSGVERRRRWPWDAKIRLVEETLAPGMTVAEVSRRHGVAQSLLFYWRRLARDVQLGPHGAPVLLPVEVTPSAAVAPVTPEPAPRRGLIEIELGDGRFVRVDSDVDAGALRRVLDVLERR
ncbi:IS2 insertion element repressor InsA [Magnetospirillum gryphiswaldense MSR-1 v2]|jgi:transposase|uniref:IS2 insertion element repressor InsA n=1 Tax=Magnetospirillum gryphiswaldense (strain DSM 6361 / JCM 21280 / NBRC 15271 / MSR-1) TaxID=431944 RepID=V6F5H1_MAGGM|nr:transposase [Magnetospirillum gryphiswaldense]CDK99556.1 IS2 insertion element repressor InsA [Magnetospirillum gryphiswaldense MSR-1 v2]